MAGTELDKSGLVAYVPVISRAYLEFLETHQDHDDIFITDKSINDSLRQLQKDLRALPPDTAAHILETYLGRSVQTISKTALGDYVEAGRHLIMPDDDVSEYLISDLKIPRSQVELLPVFLRWNRGNIDLNVEIVPDEIVDIGSIKPHILASLSAQMAESNDWWRQVAAVAVDGETKIVGVQRNRYLPNDYSAELDGDMRSQLNRGSAGDAYNIIHAEAMLVAQATKDGISLNNCDLYVTTFPCQSCAKLLSQSGVSKIYYFDGYAANDGIPVLRAEGITLIQVQGGRSLVADVASGRSSGRPYPQRD